jgi:hypothetical protein
MIGELEDFLQIPGITRQVIGMDLYIPEHIAVTRISNASQWIEPQPIAQSLGKFTDSTMSNSKPDNSLIFENKPMTGFKLLHSIEYMPGLSTTVRSCDSSAYLQDPRGFVYKMHTNVLMALLEDNVLVNMELLKPIIYSSKIYDMVIPITYSDNKLCEYVIQSDKNHRSPDWSWIALGEHIQTHTGRYGYYVGQHHIINDNQRSSMKSNIFIDTCNPLSDPAYMAASGTPQYKYGKSIPVSLPDSFTLKNGSRCFRSLKENEQYNINVALTKIEDISLTNPETEIFFIHNNELYQTGYVDEETILFPKKCFGVMVDELINNHKLSYTHIGILGDGLQKTIARRAAAIDFYSSKEYFRMEVSITIEQVNTE